jgi:putative tryptophan/tyrosine transport system substrate-binding protein
MTALALTVMLALGIFLVPLASDAQQATKVYRIGRLIAGPPTLDPNPSLEAFRQGLRELGYVEGQNLVIEYRYAEGSEERLRALATELVRLHVDLIVAGGSASIRAAQQATHTIPIVMATAAYDAVMEGFVASLAQPGGNITGLSNLGDGLPGKRLEILKEALPQSTHIAMLTNPASPLHVSAMHTLTGAAQALGLRLHTVEVHHADELDTAFAAMTRAGADALIVLEDSLVLSTLNGQIAERATTARLPAMYGWRKHVDGGGLMSYGPSMADMQRRAAVYVDKILKGTTPANLPVEQPMKFELVINLKTAQALGLTVPPSLLFQADEVIR